MTRQDLHDAVLSDLENRSTWDQRMNLFYQMRHHGLRRRNKPWVGASDIHFPLGDMSVGKLVPHYFQQLYATDSIASFIPLTQQSVEFTVPVAQWFDWKLKQKSNLEREVVSLIDYMLCSGRTTMKTIWDARQKRLLFSAVDPAHVIVPALTTELESCDRFCHVCVYSPDRFVRTYGEQSEEVLSKIVASSIAKERGDSSVMPEKFRREGITDLRDHIVVWEVWHREGEKWFFEAWPATDPLLTVVEKRENPYDHGELPFVDFCYEVKDKSSWYSPRGVLEKVAFAEAELCNLLNQKNDAMSLYNRPLFRSSRDIPNAGNLQFKPAQILPFDLQPVAMPQPPISFDQHITLMREIAENLITTPDYGLSRTLDNSQRRTATEVNAIGQLFQTSNDLRLRLFRMSLGRLYRQAWRILLQFDKTSLDYWYSDALQTVPQQALHEKYRIEPSGSADGVNKAFIQQKAVQRFQMFNGHPFVNQGELAKSVLEADDATLVKRLYADPGEKAVDQAEQQALEICSMRIGFPAPVKPSDDHATHVKACLAYVQQQMQAQQPPQPAELQALQQHLMAHIEILKKVNPDLARAAMDAMQLLAQPPQPSPETQPAA